MSTYYVAGIPYSDELYHHGIKGQKWGMRRYQNEDGTLTPAGKERYGSSDGLGTSNPKSLLRRLAIGDTPFGFDRHRHKREARLAKKAEASRESGNTAKAEKYQSKYEAQKKKNIDIEKYVSNQSTGKLWAQNFLMPGISDRYRASRAAGRSRGRSYVDSIMPGLNLNPLNFESVTQKISDKKKYGNLAHSGT